jgi:PAS domain S-box-containing protein/putative nucleotidyltransferase with HDIG domain
MDIPLRVLIIEDSDRDVALEVRALKAAGYEITYAVAETAAAMAAALNKQAFDIVISDNDMPQFDAQGALAVLKQSGLDIPFIIVSGEIGQEIGVALMRAGAHDFVMKDSPARLVPAVQRELREAESRRERKRAEDELRESEERLRDIMFSIADWVWEVDENGVYTYSSQKGIDLFGESRRDIIGKTPFDFMPPDEAKRVAAIFSEIVANKAPIKDLENWNIRGNGERICLLTNGVPILDEKGNIKGYRGVDKDITDSKRAEERLKETLENLKNALNTTIQVMVSAVEIRDPYTAGHQIRSADLACAIAAEMGLPKEQVGAIRMAGSIHDIGKLSIPAEILSKPTKLSDLEFSMIKEHARKGFEMLKDVESPWPLAEIVYQHHERMDGSGYPRNLKGEEICMEARILTVADVVEAMASHRPYRAGLGSEAALNEIQKNRGIFYDDAVADACLRLFREKGFQLEGTYFTTANSDRSLHVVRDLAHE